MISWNKLVILREGEFGDRKKVFWTTGSLDHGGDTGSMSMGSTEGQV